LIVLITNAHEAFAKQKRPVLTTDTKLSAAGGF